MCNTLDSDSGFYLQVIDGNSSEIEVNQELNFSTSNSASTSPPPYVRSAAWSAAERKCGGGEVDAEIYDHEDICKISAREMFPINSALS